MKELFSLIFRFKFKALFFDETENGFIKFFRYCFVGGIAFLVDYGVFSAVLLIFGKGSIAKFSAVAAGFICGLIANFLLSKKFVFTEDAKNVSRKGEFIWYTVIGVVGLALNELLMFAITDWVFTMNEFIAKIIVALIVLVYNYAARKILLYSK